MIHITPTDLVAKHNLDPKELPRLRKLANAPDRQCDNCDNPAWKYIGNGLCFSCNTGEADDSNDYELLPEDDS